MSLIQKICSLEAVDYRLSQKHTRFKIFLLDSNLVLKKKCRGGKIMDLFQVELIPFVRQNIGDLVNERREQTSLSRV